MKRSLLALASVVAIAALSVVDYVASRCVAIYHAAEAAFKAVVLTPALQVAAEASNEPASPPAVALRRAGQFVVRLLQRQRPEITPQWRMVTSV